MAKPKCVYETTCVPSHNGHSARSVEMYSFKSKEEAEDFKKLYDRARAQVIQDLIPDISVFEQEDVKEWTVEVVQGTGDLTGEVAEEYFSDVHDTVETCDEW